MCNQKSIVKSAIRKADVAGIEPFIKASIFSLFFVNEFMAAMPVPACPHNSSWLIFPNGCAATP